MYIRPRQGLREQMSASQFMAPSNQELTMAHLPHAAAAGDCRRVLDTTQHSLLNMDQMMQPEAAAAQLMQRAEALQAAGDSHAAVQALDDLLTMTSSHRAALSLRATLHGCAGRWQSALFDLLQLQKVAPGWPGLLERLQEVAAQCSRENRAAPVRPVRQYARVRRCGAPGAGTAQSAVGGCGGAGAESLASAYGVLGLPLGASYADVRAAYKQLAARWHPDKQVAQEQECQGAGSDRFISVQAAYQLLKPALSVGHTEAKQPLSPQLGEGR